MYGASGFEGMVAVFAASAAQFSRHILNGRAERLESERRTRTARQNEQFTKSARMFPGVERVLDPKTGRYRLVKDGKLLGDYFFDVPRE